MKRFFLHLTVALTAACTAGTPLSEQVVRSEMARCPEGSWLDGREGTLKWNYTTGLELKAFLDVYDEMAGQAGHDVQDSHDAGKHSRPAVRHSRLDRESVFDYVEDWYDAIIDEHGRIPNYKRTNYTLDHICPGRTLFRLYELTGKEKYRKVMDTLYVQLQEQPRTPEGGFWHKKIYPQQMWLDGLYMAMPFYALYTAQFVPEEARAANYADIVHQFTLIYDHTFDPATGLLRHAWDSSHEMFWCDPGTGQSAHAWGRAMGWYAMALADVIPEMPEGEGHDALVNLLNRLFIALPLFADPETGLWYQVLDRPGEEGNYLEATCNAMFAYALLKGTREGWLENITRADAHRTYASMVKAFVRVDEEGLVHLDSCCEVAGLGGKTLRRGDYDYYINEPVCSDDPKGIGPLIWAALEAEKK